MKKEVQIDHTQTNTYHLAKIAKIGPVDPEIICLLSKKIEITLGKFAERAK